MQHMSSLTPPDKGDVTSFADARGEACVFSDFVFSKQEH